MRTLLPTYLHPGCRCPWVNVLCSRLDLHQQSRFWELRGCLPGGIFLPQDLSCRGLWLLRLFAGNGSSGRSPGSSPAADPAKQLACLREWLWVLNEGVMGREDAWDLPPARIRLHNARAGRAGGCAGARAAVPSGRQRRARHASPRPDAWGGFFSSADAAQPCAGRRVHGLRFSSLSAKRRCGGVGTSLARGLYCCPSPCSSILHPTLCPIPPAVLGTGPRLLMELPGCPSASRTSPLRSCGTRL